MEAKRVLKTELSVSWLLVGTVWKWVSKCRHLWRKRGKGKSEAREKH